MVSLLTRFCLLTNLLWVFKLDCMDSSENGSEVTSIQLYIHACQYWLQRILTNWRDHFPEISLRTTYIHRFAIVRMMPLPLAMDPSVATKDTILATLVNPSHLQKETVTPWSNHGLVLVNSEFHGHEHKQWWCKPQSPVIVAGRTAVRTGTRTTRASRIPARRTTWMAIS